MGLEREGVKKVWVWLLVTIKIVKISNTICGNSVVTDVYNGFKEGSQLVN